MTSPANDSWLRAWSAFAQEMVGEVDREWKADSSNFSWVKQDGSYVSGLDLRLDVKLRIILARHFPAVAVLSEETGLLSPADRHGSTLAIVDPVDGTDSLLRNRPAWWVSVGVIDGIKPVDGLIYQPVIQKIHDSTAPERKRCPNLVVGLSPNQLKTRKAAPLREHLMAEGAKLAATPHSVEKIASVLEGRCAATVYVPSAKSPHWHTWDLAACLAIATANELPLRTLDGRQVEIEEGRPERSDPWICAQDEATWRLVRQCLK